MAYDKELAKLHRRKTKDNIPYSLQYSDRNFNLKCEIPSGMMDRTEYLRCVCEFGNYVRNIVINDLMGKFDEDTINGISRMLEHYDEKSLAEHISSFSDYAKTPIRANTIDIGFYEDEEYGDYDGYSHNVYARPSYVENDEELFARLDAEELVNEQRRKAKAEKELQAKKRQFEALKKELGYE